MQKGLIRKGLALSILVLFITICIHPVFAEKSIISTSDTKEDCIKCLKPNGYNFLKYKLMLCKLIVGTNIILSSRLGDAPKIKEKSEKILINLYKSNSVFCDNLYEYLMSFVNYMKVHGMDIYYEFEFKMFARYVDLLVDIYIILCYDVLNSKFQKTNDIEVVTEFSPSSKETGIAFKQSSLSSNIISIKNDNIQTDTFDSTIETGGNSRLADVTLNINREISANVILYRQLFFPTGDFSVKTIIKYDCPANVKIEGEYDILSAMGNAYESLFFYNDEKAFSIINGNNPSDKVVIEWQNSLGSSSYGFKSKIRGYLFEYRNIDGKWELFGFDWVCRNDNMEVRIRNIIN